MFALNEHVAEHAILLLFLYLSCDTVGYVSRISFATHIFKTSCEKQGITTIRGRPAATVGLASFWIGPKDHFLTL